MTSTSTEAPRLRDLMDPAALATAIDDGHVRSQAHPRLPLRIYNYTERAVYEGAWTEVTRQCRGLIIHEADARIIARPWRKFFNYGEHPDGPLDLTAAAEVTDKVDGSLGILYPAADTFAGWAIATRGSFASEQAQHATALLEDRYPDFVPPEGMTCLFEIVYAANRIVVDYGSRDDLVLLGAVNIATGQSVGPDWVSGWDGPIAETFPARTLGDALALAPRPNAEGVVVRMVDSGLHVKLKQADYVALHRILTQTTARSVWEYLAVDACKHLITAPKHWGSRLSMDPDRAVAILAIGDDWMSRLTEGVPDEFHGWLRSTIDGLTARVGTLRASLELQATELLAEHGSDRKAFALAVAPLEHSGALFLLRDGRDITTYLWRDAYPAAEKAWGARSEDVA